VHVKSRFVALFGVLACFSGLLLLLLSLPAFAEGQKVVGSGLDWMTTCLKASRGAAGKVEGGHQPHQHLVVPAAVCFYAFR
jgi:hypothetical protein